MPVRSELEYAQNITSVLSISALSLNHTAKMISQEDTRASLSRVPHAINWMYFTYK